MSLQPAVQRRLGNVLMGFARAGFGQMLARPLFRERHRPDMSEEEATQLLHDALRVRVSCCLCWFGLGAECLPCQLRCGTINLGEVWTMLTLQMKLQVCYYRDKQTTNKFQIAKVSGEGVTVSEPFALETQWGYQARSCYASSHAACRCH